MSAYPQPAQRLQLYHVLRDSDKCEGDCLVTFARISKLESWDEISGCSRHSDFPGCLLALIKQPWGLLQRTQGSTCIFCTRRAVCTILTVPLVMDHVSRDPYVTDRQHGHSWRKWSFVLWVVTHGRHLDNQSWCSWFCSLVALSCQASFSAHAAQNALHHLLSFQSMTDRR
jgi:hypothetical protein